MPAKKTNKTETSKAISTPKKVVKSTASAAKKTVASSKKETTPIKIVTPKATKKAVSSKPRAAKAPAPAPVMETPVISIEEIQLRAYYISERRQTMGWPGNSSTDWIEAEAQLVAEAKRRLKSLI